MKRIIPFLFLLLPLSAQATGGLAGGYDYQLYYTPEGKPYIESYFWISGPSLSYKTEGNKKKAAIEVTLILSQKGQVTFYDKYIVESREYAANDSAYSDVLDLRRYAMPEGMTTVELYIKDVYATTDRSIERRDSLDVTLLTAQKTQLSSIEFVEMYQPSKQQTAYSKAGYDILPYVGALYEESVDKLVFYAEIYNTIGHFGSNGKFLLTYYLENNESGRQLENYTVRKREFSKTIIPILAEMNISKLAAGNYNMVVEIRDSLNKFVCKSSRVFRRENSSYEMTESDFANLNIENTFVNSLNNTDSVIEYIHSLRPISSETEYQYGKNVIKNGDPTLMKRYLLSFWVKRNSYDPLGEFQQYNKLCALVDEKFGTKITRGYNTDRGRVYLRYGPPNVMNARYNEPSTYPYEIWQYYQLKGQNNIRFVFYSPNQVSNDFQLLHSDLRGEINNRQWEMVLFQRLNNNVYGVDQNSPNEDPYGNWSRDLYNQPR